MEGEGDVCSICSHDNSIGNPRGTLPAGTVLEGKYLVGEVRSQNDLTIVYIGLDLNRGRRVYLEEFMPRAYADRSGDGATIAAAGENQAQYKTLLSDIKERWKNVGSIENKGLLKLRELLTVNNTAVCVSPYIAYTTLEQYLEEQGPMDWSRVKALFMPFLSLVSTLHNRGITHYGISPENVVVDRKGTLRLIGFALPELRTVGKGLSPQLYDGYSAPEQYAKNQWQGEWSDIYALGAILYRALSGEDPPPATQRSRSDSLVPLSARQPEIPEYVSAAVAKAMELDRKERHPSIDFFTAALLEETGSNTTVFRPEPPARAPAQEPQRKPPLADGKHLLVLGLAASLILNMVLGAGWLSAQPEEPPSSVSVEEPEEPAPLMEDFTGAYWPFLRSAWRTIRSSPSPPRRITMIISRREWCCGSRRRRGRSTRRTDRWCSPSARGPNLSLCPGWRGAPSPPPSICWTTRASAGTRISVRIPPLASRWGRWCAIPPPVPR